MMYRIIKERRIILQAEVREEGHRHLYNRKCKYFQSIKTIVPSDSSLQGFRLLALESRFQVAESKIPNPKVKTLPVLPALSPVEGSLVEGRRRAVDQVLCNLTRSGRPMVYLRAKGVPGDQFLETRH